MSSAKYGLLRSVIAAIATLMAATSLHAAPITFTFSGSSTGSLDGVDFGLGDFIITATGDTDFVSSPTGMSEVFTLQHTAASIFIDPEIGGDLVLDFVSPTQTFFNDAANFFGFQLVNGVDNQSSDLLRLNVGNSLDGYQLAGPAGVSGPGELLQWDGIPTFPLDVLVNDGGPDDKVLFFDQASLEVTIEGDFTPVDVGAPSPVPLPAALPLFAGGIGLLGLLGWRRKRMASA